MKYTIRALTFILLLFSNHLYAFKNLTSVALSYAARGFVISNDGSRAYVATGTCNTRQNVQQGVIDVIDLKSMTLKGHINIPVKDKGCLSGQLFLTTDENKLYADYTREIAVIDTNTLNVSKIIKLSVNDNINHVVSAPDSARLYYSISTFNPNDNIISVLDTKTDSFIEAFPNVQGAFTYGVYGMAMGFDGKTIYQIPGAEYQELQPLIALEITNKKSVTIATLPKDTRLLTDGLMVSKEDKTFYVSTKYNYYGNPTRDWYIYAIDRSTMKFREVYHAEHQVLAIGLSNSESELYILDSRLDHKKITILNPFTGSFINEIVMPNEITHAKVLAKNSRSTIFYTTEPGNGNGSLFNAISFTATHEK